MTLRKDGLVIVIVVRSRNRAGNGGRVSQKHSHEADNVRSEAHFNLLDLPHVRFIDLISSLEHI
jgi:hypothetical protein